VVGLRPTVYLKVHWYVPVYCYIPAYTILIDFRLYRRHRGTFDLSAEKTNLFGYFHLIRHCFTQFVWEYFEPEYTVWYTYWYSHT
jgi:hypothetical protein